MCAAGATPETVGVPGKPFALVFRSPAAMPATCVPCTENWGSNGRLAYRQVAPGGANARAAITFAVVNDVFPFGYPAGIVNPVGSKKGCVWSTPSSITPIFIPCPAVENVGPQRVGAPINCGVRSSLRWKRAVGQTWAMPETCARRETWLRGTTTARPLNVIAYRQRTRAPRTRRSIRAAMRDCCAVSAWTYDSEAGERRSRRCRVCVTAASARSAFAAAASPGRSSVTTSSTLWPRAWAPAGAARASSATRSRPRLRTRIVYRWLGYTASPRGCGGIGRRARFRSVWGQPRGGSSPLIRTGPAGSIRCSRRARRLRFCLVEPCVVGKLRPERHEAEIVGQCPAGEHVRRTDEVVHG